MDGFPRGGRDLVHRSINEGIGRRAVLFEVFQIGMDGHCLRLPRLLGCAGTDIAADGPKLGIGNAHQTVHKIQRDIAAQALPLDVQVRHGDGVAGAEQPAQAVFFFYGHKHGIRAADGRRGRRCCRGQQTGAKGQCQHSRCRAPCKLIQMFQRWCPPVFSHILRAFFSV